jgi:hypothetical protein
MTWDKDNEASLRVVVQNEEGQQTPVYLTDASGNPITGSNQLPVTLGSNSITITGDVNVGTTVNVASTPSDPVHVHLTEVGTSGILDVPYAPVWINGGNVSLDAGVKYIGKVRLTDGTNDLSFDQPANDGESGQYSLPVENYNMVFNGSSWDRLRGNVAAGAYVTIKNTSLVVTQDATPWQISANSSPNTSGNPIFVNVTNSELEISNTVNNPIPVVGNVNATISNAQLEIINDVGNPIPVTGNVNVNVVNGNVEIKNDVGNPIPVTGNITVKSDPTSFSYVKYIDSDNPQMDVTQRLRVAIPQQQWWYIPSVDKDGDLRFVEKFTGTSASSTFVQNLAAINISSGTDSNGQAIRISRRRHKMMPGVSISFSQYIGFNGTNANVAKRVGMFTSFNGIFFEVTDDLYLVIRRRLIDGTLVEKRIPRNQFSHDKLDGSGTSTFNFGPVDTLANTQTLNVISSNLTAHTGNVTVTVNSTLGYYVYDHTFACDDTSKFDVGDKVTVTGVTPTTFNRTAQIVDKDASTITIAYIYNPGAYTSMSSAKISQTKLHMNYQFGFDFNGSRSSRVRFNIESDEGANVIHIEDFAGDISTQFSNAPALPTRVELTNTGTITGLPTLTIGPETVNVEAEAVLNPGFGVATNNTAIQYQKNNIGLEQAVLGVGLRVGEPYQRADIQVQGLNIIDVANVNPQNSGVYQWRLILNPTLTGVIPASTNIGKASQQWAYGSNVSVSGGTTLLSGYATSVTQLDIRTALNFINLGSNVDNTDADKIVLAVQVLVDGNAQIGKIIATMNIIESL